ncbi:hypothetical protein GCM10020254_67400 [Streptomyces goshikiensis]
MIFGLLFAQAGSPRFLTSRWATSAVVPWGWPSFLSIASYTVALRMPSAMVMTFSLLGSVISSTAAAADIFFLSG